MDKFFVIVFAALTLVCLLAVVIAGRFDYLFLAVVCGIAAMAGRMEVKRSEKESSNN
ncbi:MAG: hypothetical protein Q4C26_03050 [Bacteroidales bacterium]|nr:hypothetical protein [Bacteroidales bacterium]